MFKVLLQPELPVLSLGIYAEPPTLWEKDDHA